MNETKNILLKLFILLTCGVGWSSGAWAQSDNIVLSNAPTGSEWADGTTWFRLKISNGGYFSTSYLSSGAMASNNTAVPDYHGLWCFVQNNDNTVSIFNYAEGTTKVLGTTKDTGSSGGAARTNVYSTNSIPDNVETHYEYGSNGAGGYWFKLKSVSNGYLNNRSPFIAMWTNSGAANNDGSAILLTKTGTFGSYSVILPDGYHVKGNLSEDLIGNEGTVSFFGMPATSVKVVDADNKFVWGPIVDEENKTIKYEISDPVAPQAGKWYQIQILPKGNRYFNNGGNQSTSNMVESLNGLSQTRRKSNYIYLHQDDTYTNNYPIDLAGYYEGKEAMSYIYVPAKGGSANSITLALQTLTGRYVNHQGISTTGSGAQAFNLTPDNSDGSFSWNGGVRPWTNLGTPSHLTFGFSGSNGSQCFYTYFTEVNPAEKFDAYRVNVVGGNDNATVTYNGSGNHGLSTVYNGGYFFLNKGENILKENFTCSLYGNIRISVGKADANGVRTLTIKEIDPLATEPWTVRTPEGFSAIYRGDEVKNAETFFVRPNTTPKAADLEITEAEGNDGALAQKFVWGPVIDSRYKTITYEVRDRATELSNGWYQMQLAMPEADIISIHNKIKDEEGNINTSANTLYLAPTVYDVDVNKKFKITGIPNYAGQEATYVKIDMTSASSLTITNTRTGGTMTGNYTFADNKLTVTNWAIDGTAHPLEGPNVGSGSTPLSFALGTVDMAQYDLYKVVLAGEASGVEVAIDNGDARGTTTLGNGGYLFMRKGSVPATENFSVAKGTGAVTALSITGDVITLTIGAPTKEWTVRINDSNYKVVYNDTQYADGETVSIPASAEPALAFKTTCTDQFVWGPVVDTKTNTVTFEVRELPATLETGWYQMMLIEDPDNANPQHRPTAANVNQRIANVSGNINTQSNYIYVTPLYNLANNWLGKMTGIPTYGEEPVTYFYIEKNGSNLSIQSPNGLYTGNGSRLDMTSVSKQTFTNYNFDNGILKVGGWTAPGHWNSTSCSGIEGPNVANGTSSEYYQSQYLTKIDVDAKYNVYQVSLPSGVSNVKYLGSGIHGNKTVYNHGYFFLTKGVTPTKENFKLEGGVDINSISISAENVITFDATIPTYADKQIVHRQAYYYDDVEDDQNPPSHGFIKAGEGMSSRNNGAIVEQNTAVYEVPVYLKPGDANAFTSYLPTNQITRYQRWYNWDTDGQVDGNVLTSLAGWSVSDANTYTNGHLTGSGYDNKYKDKPQFKLPADKTSYNVGLDISHYPTRGTIGNGLVEPTLNMRIVYQVRDAKIIAKAIKESTKNNTFYEVHNISFPNIKHGNDEDRTSSNLLPLDMDLNNYWIFKTDNEENVDLQQLLESNGAHLEVQMVEHSEGADLKNIMVIPSGQSSESGRISRSGFNTGHFILFKYPDSGVVPANSTAKINVYIKSSDNSKTYNLAQFNLTFIGNSEPVAVTDLPGSSRHPDALVEDFGAPVAELTFDNKTNNEFGSWYRYPLDYKGVSYAFGTQVAGGYHTGYFASRGEYGLTGESGSSSALGGGSYNYYPVNNYLRNMSNIDAAIGGTKESDSYFLYIDAADQPGKIASIELEETLCAGSRLYCYGYIGCTSGGTGTQGTTDQHPTSILINVMGINKDTGKEELVYSYCPGIITLRAYSSDNRRIYASALGRGTVYEPHGNQADYWAPWQQIGFSFSISAAVANRMKGYSIQIVNNAYNSTGADTVLDDFQIYVNPPKGNVDFTTPLCSDKVRHAKIHTDFEMLKNISGNINESDPKLSATYCFLDAEIFDNFTEGELKISDMFEMDDKGNHNLKSGYSESDDDVLNIINHAFRKALVGSRYIKSSGKEDYGFHSFDIPYNFDDIPTYAYNDSKEDEVYGEVDGQGVRRLVFKENVVRGEMQMKPAEDALHPAYWPYMRPSRTYYLVFSPVAITQQSEIDAENTATQIFGIHDNCSFFGKFTTKDPLHVILDNADIESDLPIRAVCHGETTAFSFDIPALKVDKPIVDEAYCISVDSLNGKIVPESQGLNHYKYEASFKSNNISGVIKNLPYDWWMGGLKFDNETTYRGTIEDYHAAKHPTIRYDHNTADPNHTHTHAADYKKHQEPVDISLAMQDFRFFYPDFKEGDDWGTLQVHDYDNDSGYSLLRSEINAIKDLVEKGIIILHRNTYDMPLTYEEAEELQAKELNDMMEKEMNDHILELALKLNTDPVVAALYPLKALEGTVLDKLSPDGKKRLTFEEFGSFTRDQLVDIAGDLQTQKNKLTELTSEQINAMQEGELRRVIEAALRELPDDEMLGFAKDYFPNIGHEKRAYLVVRALNILSRETVAKMPEADQQNTTKVRAKLREQMISIFSAQDERVLRKMWSDTSAKLTEEERAALLKDALHPETPKDPAAMNADGLAVLIEDALAQLTNNVIDDLKGDRYVHFTLVPVMPSQETFVDEPYIFCPEPRGVKLRITSHAPRMIDGFADMPYPEDMENVPVRLGLTQIKETKESTGKNLRIPVRGLKKAAKDGEKAIKLTERTGYYTDIFLTETDDPQYQQTAKAGMAEAKNVEGIYTRMVGKVNAMVAVYPTAENQNPDNYLEVSFENDMMFREGYTYRVGVNYMEVKEVEVEGVKVTKPTISCPGEMLLDLKIVPEYQKWTASVNNDWTNDRNWARASRAELNAGNAAAGDKIDDKATDLDDASSYIDNDGDGGNGTASAFVPMYFTNVLIDKDASAPVLYTEKETEESDAYTPASRSGKTFLKGLHSTATDRIIYDMEVTPADGKGTWPVSEGDYECTLFGTYIANGVTFEPGAQLGNAHYLTYNKAWVEYELDAGRWYTLGSGLKASVAGDWYSPTAGGKQKTPHFYDINYDPANNDRFRPAYYQRSWDRGGNNIVYEKSGGTYDSFVKADWSYVYNDAAVNYSVGGFSVKPELGYMDPEDRPADGKVLVRLPKADASYTYYDKAGDIGQADPAQIGNRAELKSYRLMSDDLNADGSGTINMSVANESADNNFLLLSNPFMAAMDMDEFFAVNDGLEAQYWVVDADRQDVSVKSTDGTWITTGDGNGKYVAPLQGFFVKTKNSTNSVEASYTADMQTVVDLDALQRPVVLQAPATRAASATEAGIIRLTAVRNDRTSTAIIMLNDNASDGNVSGEDCETFIDGNLYELPTVYTSAGNVAQTINVRQSLKMVPVGMISADDSETMLRFDISDDIVDSLYLYDAELDSITEIADGTEVMMSGNNAGRYFITDSVEDNMMTATATVQQGVYTPSGIYVGKTTKGLQPGLYIVDGVKMMVK